jgi:hypothetical protein
MLLFENALFLFSLASTVVAAHCPRVFHVECFSCVYVCGGSSAFIVTWSTVDWFSSNWPKRNCNWAAAFRAFCFECCFLCQVISPLLFHIF